MLSATPTPYYAAIFAAIALGVGGQLLLKAGAQRSADIAGQFLNLFTLAGFAVYACSAALYAISLRKLPLSIAFPSVSLSYIAVAVIGHLIWREPLGWQQTTAIALIVLGVALLNYAR